MSPYPVTTERWGTLTVVRDDLLLGGSKRRALTPVMRDLMAQGFLEFVFGGPAEGYAQLALAYSAAEIGAQATYFVAQRRQRYRYTLEAERAGAAIVEVPHGRLNVVQRRARDYCAQTGAYFFPLGFSTPAYEERLTAEIAAALSGLEMTETWCVAGSGLLTRCLQAARPDVPHHAVRIGFEPSVGSAILHVAPEDFGEEAQDPPPWPSASHYDAKAWRFMRQHAQPGALFWNVGR